MNIYIVHKDKSSTETQKDRLATATVEDGKIKIHDHSQEVLPSIYFIPKGQHLQGA